MPINARPIAIKIPCLLSDVVALNNSMPPVRPRNNVAVPPITRSKGMLGIISGEKIPESNTKNPNR